MFYCDRPYPLIIEFESRKRKRPIFSDSNPYEMLPMSQTFHYYKLNSWASSQENLSSGFAAR